jgi:hypothetical protein
MISMTLQAPFCKTYRPPSVKVVVFTIASAKTDASIQPKCPKRPEAAKLAQIPIRQVSPSAFLHDQDPKMG